MNDEKDNLYALTNKNNGCKFPSFYLDPINIELNIKCINDIHKELIEFAHIFKINDNEKNNLKLFLNSLILKSIIHYLKCYLKIQYKNENNNFNKNILELKNEISPLIKEVDKYLKNNFVNIIINFQNKIDISILSEYVKIIIKDLSKDECKKMIEIMNNHLFISVLHFLKENNKTIFPTIIKFINRENLFENCYLYDIFMLIYKLNNYKFNPQEKEDYTKIVNILCDKLNVYLKNNPSIYNFYDNPITIFEHIYNRAELNRKDYEEIKNIMTNKWSELRTELFKNGKFISAKFDFTEYKDLLLTKNGYDLTELTYLFIELTHNAENKLNLFITPCDSNIEISLVDKLVNGEYENYDSWYKPRNIFNFEENLEIWSHSFRLHFFTLDYILQFLENHLFTIIYYFSINDNTVLNNPSTIEGIKTLLKLLTLMKNEMYEYVKYSLIICSINLIENIFKNILNIKDKETKLNTLLENKTLNDVFDSDLLNFIKYIFLKVNIKENGSSHGYDLRNKIMHGEFIFDSRTNFVKVIYLLFCVFNEIYIKYVKKIVKID